MRPEQHRALAENAIARLDRTPENAPSAKTSDFAAIQAHCLLAQSTGVGEHYEAAERHLAAYLAFVKNPASATIPARERTSRLALLHANLADRA